jgi:hypothetical protein
LFKGLSVGVGGQVYEFEAPDERFGGRVVYAGFSAVQVAVGGGRVLIVKSQFAKCELLVRHSGGKVAHLEFAASYIFENQSLS